MRLRQREITVCSVFFGTTLYRLAPSCVRVCAIVRSSDPDFFWISLCSYLEHI